jgi:hypothetical protein
MGFNYARERLLFEEAWNKLRVEYRKAGMPRTIEELYRFDLKWFHSRRRYANHTVPLRTERMSKPGLRSLISFLQ